ncbi:MAG: T9SS type A sorting domain-containing protein [Bacteroidales bacterium]|nr:T9SS type A sorting domain-containing protein [Bacteroidales bacterium]
MKKFLTFIFLIAFLQLNAQIVLTESFENNPLPSGKGQDIPVGWKAETKVSGGKPIWRIKESFFVRPKAVLPIDGSFLIGYDSLALPERAFDEWLITSEIELLNTSRTNIVTFYSFHDSDGSHTLRISSDGGVNWETIWTDNDTKSTYSDRCMDSSTIDVAIPDSYKGKKVKVAWVFEAATCNSAWAIDFITIEAVISGVDVMPRDFVSPLNHVDTINSQIMNTDIPVVIRVINNGRTDAENVPISYTLNGGTPVSETIPLIKPKETVQYTFSEKINIDKQSINTLVVNTNAAGDELPENNATSTLTFWVLDTNKSIIYDFEDPALLDTAIWANSDYKFYDMDGQTPFIQSYENIFQGFPWVVGVGGGTLYPKVWGIYAAFSYSYFQSVSTPADRWLVLPQCRINSSSEPVFLQWNAASSYQKNHESYEFESYEVLISTGSNEMEDFVKVHEVASEKYFNPNEPIYPYNRSVDISAYKGKDIYIAFRLTTSGTTTRGMFVLDNIEIFGDAEIVTDNISEAKADLNIKLFPNPVSEMLYLESKNRIQKIEIFNLMGQKVNEIELDNYNTSIQTAVYDNGLYIVKVKTTEGEIIRKINIVK